LNIVDGIMGMKPPLRSVRPNRHGQSPASSAGHTGTCSATLDRAASGIWLNAGLLEKLDRRTAVRRGSCASQSQSLYESQASPCLSPGASSGIILGEGLLSALFQLAAPSPSTDTPAPGSQFSARASPSRASSSMAACSPQGLHRHTLAVSEVSPVPATTGVSSPPPVLTPAAVTRARDARFRLGRTASQSSGLELTEAAGGSGLQPSGRGSSCTSSSRAVAFPLKDLQRRIDAQRAAMAAAPANCHRPDGETDKAPGSLTGSPCAARPAEAPAVPTTPEAMRTPTAVICEEQCQPMPTPSCAAGSLSTPRRALQDIEVVHGEWKEAHDAEVEHARRQALELCAGSDCAAFREELARREAEYRVQAVALDRELSAGLPAKEEEIKLLRERVAAHRHRKPGELLTRAALPVDAASAASPQPTSMADLPGRRPPTDASWPVIRPLSAQSSVGQAPGGAQLKDELPSTPQRSWRPQPRAVEGLPFVAAPPIETVRVVHTPEPPSARESFDAHVQDIGKCASSNHTQQAAQTRSTDTSTFGSGGGQGVEDTAEQEMPWAEVAAPLKLDLPAELFEFQVGEDAASESGAPLEWAATPLVAESLTSSLRGTPVTEPLAMRQQEPDELSTTQSVGAPRQQCESPRQSSLPLEPIMPVEPAAPPLALRGAARPRARRPCSAEEAPGPAPTLAAATARSEAAPEVAGFETLDTSSQDGRLAGIRRGPEEHDLELPLAAEDAEVASIASAAGLAGTAEVQMPARSPELAKPSGPSGPKPLLAPRLC